MNKVLIATRAFGAHAKGALIAEAREIANILRSQHADCVVAVQRQDVVPAREEG